MDHGKNLILSTDSFFQEKVSILKNQCEQVQQCSPAAA